VPFTGIFQGNGYSIRNINIILDDSSASFTGLFGMLENADISGLGVENIRVDDANGTSWCVGGFCGQNQGSTISECYVEHAALRAGHCVGGFCGLNSYGGVISNCYAQGSVSGSDLVGGFCGYNYRYSQLVNSYAACIVVTDGVSGGFCSGADASAAFNSCFWDVDVAGLSYSCGGIGVHTPDMENAATFFEWDFIDVWIMKRYPVLQLFDDSMAYMDWLEYYSVPLSLRGENDSPANDGVPNLIKYACGLPAMTPASTPDFLAIIKGDPGLFSVQYRVSRSALSVKLEPVWSNTAVGPWLTNGVEKSILYSGTDSERWKASIPLSSSGFIKLRASQVINVSDDN
jgi:hypothetical protein